MVLVMGEETEMIEIAEITGTEIEIGIETGTETGIVSLCEKGRGKGNEKENEKEKEKETGIEIETGDTTVEIATTGIATGIEIENEKEKETENESTGTAKGNVKDSREQQEKDHTEEECQEDQEEEMGTLEEVLVTGVEQWDINKRTVQTQDQLGATSAVLRATSPRIALLAIIASRRGTFTRFVVLFLFSLLFIISCFIISLFSSLFYFF
jgi:hypothetical protein